MTENWKWYAGWNDEEFHSGPFDTREEAIKELDGLRGFIIEARKTPIKLSSYFDAEYFLEVTEEDAADLSNPDGDLIFDVSKAQMVGLQDLVRAAIDQWQEVNNLVFESWAFNESRNLEQIDGLSI